VNVVLFGASGAVGRQIAAELVSHGHQVTAVSRGGVTPVDGVTSVAGDASDAAAVADLVRGSDAVISAVGPGHGGREDAETVVTTTNALIAGLRAAGVARLIVVGGAGSLETAPGVRHVDDPGFPEMYKAIALAHGDALAIYRGVTDLDWTYISPAAVIGPGPRTRVFRIGGEQLLTDSGGKSFISYDDFAVGLVEQLEHPSSIRKRITLAY
jgi:putative NADH-flavin reductase